MKLLLHYVVLINVIGLVLSLSQITNQQDNDCGMQEKLYYNQLEKIF